MRVSITGMHKRRYFNVRRPGFICLVTENNFKNVTGVPQVLIIFLLRVEL
jgi:hypothetical protein